MMPFLLAEIAPIERAIPLYVCCVGSHDQKRIVREDGYPAHQLFLTRGGEGVLRRKGRPDVVLSPGTVYALPAGAPHEYEARDPKAGWQLGFAAFGGAAADAVMAGLGDTDAEARPAPNFERLWEQLELLYQDVGADGESAPWEASRRMYAMLTLWLEGRGARRAGRAGTPPANRPLAALQTAVRLMHDHCGERLTLAGIARAAGYSAQHLHRLFVAHYGVTPQQYLLQLRMRAAVRLLQEEPGIAVGAVAEQVGMEPSYFIRMFKRTYGVTPKQYAKT